MKLERHIRSIHGMQGSGLVVVLNFLINHFFTQISDEEILEVAKNLSVEDLAKRDLHDGEVALTLTELNPLHDRIEGYLSEDVAKYAMDLKEFGLNKKEFTGYFYMSLTRVVKTTSEYQNKIKAVKFLKLQMNKVKKVLET